MELEAGCRCVNLVPSGVCRKMHVLNALNAGQTTQLPHCATTVATAFAGSVSATLEKTATR